MSLFFHVHSEKALHAILMQERARSDRSGNEFSYILLRIEEVVADKNSKNRFLTVLKKRLQFRETDIVGWYDMKSICIILPFTNLEGAKIFGTKMERIFAMHNFSFHYDIYSYSNGQRAYQTGSKLPHLPGEKELPVALAVPIPIWKRVVDLSGAVIGLLILSPVFILLAGYIKLVSPGPVFFKQQRVGYRGKTFTMYKFRTMHNNKNNEHFHKLHAVDFIKNDKQMTKLDEKNDTRIIPGGWLIRSTCLDELAQLLNVLKGEMSLVGPRPCIPYEAFAYSQWHKQRFNILPGLTGLWQISGKNKLTFQQMVRLDILYYKKLSFWQDIKIILATVPTILQIVFNFVNEKIKINNMNNEQTSF